MTSSIPKLPEPNVRSQPEPTGPGPLGGWIFGIALALLVSLPLVAIGAAVALRVFCLIAGVCE